MERPSRDVVYLTMAVVLSKRSTCLRRKVGCILIDNNNMIVATGYNGVPSNTAHCIDKPCGGEKGSSGCDLDTCMAVHAEMNAVAQCKDIFNLYKAYVTCTPCIHCCKILMNTSCREIVYLEEYPHDIVSPMWSSKDRKLTRVPSTHIDDVLLSSVLSF